MTNHPNRRPDHPARNPTPAEIRAARAEAGLTQTEAARLIYATLRTWQGWETEPPDPNHRRMHPQLWQAWLAKTGLGPAVTALPRS